MTITIYPCHVGGFQGAQVNVKTFGQKAAAGIPGGSGAEPLSGVWPALGDPLAYSLVSGRQARLKAGRYNLAASDPDYGSYQLIVPTDQTPNHTAADSSQSRIDRVVAIVKNTGVIANDYADIRIVEGTPGGGVPALPSVVDLGSGNVKELWQVTMPAGGPSTALTGFLDKRTFMPIGKVDIPGAGATPSLAAYLPPGTPVWDPIAGKMYIRDSGTGLIRDIPAGLVRDHGVFSGAVTVPPTVRYDAATTVWTAVPAESYNPSATISGVQISLAAGGIYAVRAKVVFPAFATLGPYTIYDGMYCRIERASGGYELDGDLVDGRRREGLQAVVNLSVPNIYANVDSTIKVTIDNPFATGSPAIGPIATTLWVTRIHNL